MEEKMKSRSILVCILAILVALPVTAQEKVRLALADIQIQSTQPQLAFVGKGITELIAVELAKSKNVQLVDREKRTALLEEMEFGLSGLADPSKVAEMGRLLTADYLVFGEAFDMAGTFVFSLKLVRVESGEVVWADKLSESLAKYDYVAGFFAKSLLKSLNVKAASTTVAKAETAAAKNEEALVAFSRAVEAVDRKDKTAAKKELEKAKELDPGSDAVKYYLSKLAGASPRGQVEIEIYAQTYNPALVAFLDKPQVNFWGSTALPEGLRPDEGWTWIGDYHFKETTFTGRAGILFPLGGKAGISAEAQFGMVNNNCDTTVPGARLGPLYEYSTTFDRNMLGGSLGLGVRLAPELALGAALRAGRNSRPENSTDLAWFGIEDGREFSFAAETGILYRKSDETVSADLRVLWSMDPNAYVDDGDLMVYFGNWPLTINAGATLGLLDRTLFLSCRAIGEIYYDDRSGYVLRVVPSVEWWPVDWLSLRVGGEVSSLYLLETSKLGGGGMAGVSFKLGRSTLDANFAYRFLPYRAYPGEGVYEPRILIGYTYSF